MAGFHAAHNAISRPSPSCDSPSKTINFVSDFPSVASTVSRRDSFQGAKAELVRLEGNENSSIGERMKASQIHFAVFPLQNKLTLLGQKHHLIR